MRIEQIYTGCLAHAAYYIERKGEAAIFDPLREVQLYIDKANKDNAKIKYVFETHFHADFVSGHLDLKKKTGAQIVFGPSAKPAYDALVAEDNQIFEIGDYKVKVLHYNCCFHRFCICPTHLFKSLSFPKYSILGSYQRI